MRFLTIVLGLLVLVPAFAVAQFTVVSTSPANGATSVALNTTVSITFSGPADTTKPFSYSKNFFTTIKNLSSGYWSTDRKTFSFTATLDPNSVYFLLVFEACADGGGSLTTPYGCYFTTAPSFPSSLYTVSGTVSSGTTGVSPANAIVGLSSNGVGGQQGPDLIAGSAVDASGNFTIPYVPAGTWTPITAKDANGDGTIDPATGDVIGIGAPVTVSSANLTGVNIVFQSFPPLTYATAVDSAMTYAAANFPPDRVLRGMQGDEVDSTAHAASWNFYYNTLSDPSVHRIRVQSFRVDADTEYMNWNMVGTARPLSNLPGAAPADSFITRVEAAGGKAFRLSNPAPDTLTFAATVKLGDLQYTEFGMIIPDNTKDYWGASYEFRRTYAKDSTMPVLQKLFVGDYATGNLLAITSVAQPAKDLLPSAMKLEQNYPNPFNPSTVISAQWSVASVVRLSVYNLLGQEVAVLANGEYPAGQYSFTFNGNGLASGVYFYKLTAGNYAETRSMVLMK